MDILILSTSILVHSRGWFIDLYWSGRNTLVRPRSSFFNSFILINRSITQVSQCSPCCYQYACVILLSRWLIRELPCTASYCVVCHDSRVTLRLLLIPWARSFKVSRSQFRLRETPTHTRHQLQILFSVILLFTFHSPTLIYVCCRRLSS